MVYVYASVLFIANLSAWMSTLFMLPGNWIMVVLAAAYAFFLPSSHSPRLSWLIVGATLLLAGVGELIEFAAGAAGAAKQGGSKRGAIFAILGAIAGSIGGAIAGSPLPVIGNVIGAVVGGAVGAFAGAYLGEFDREHADRMKIGQGALVGRLAGTAGKLAVGGVILVLITADSFWDFTSG